MLAYKCFISPELSGHLFNINFNHLCRCSTEPRIASRLFAGTVADENVAVKLLAFPGMYVGLASVAWYVLALSEKRIADAVLSMTPIGEALSRPI